MLKKYYKYISVNLLALAGVATAYPWWHIFFIQRPESVRNDELNHSMETVGLWMEIDFFYFICLALLINLVIIFFIEKKLRKNKEFQVISTGEKLHFGIVSAGLVLFFIPTIPLTIFNLFILLLIILFP